jgi:exodeoxyribonuclease V alpha subunit
VAFWAAEVEAWVAAATGQQDRRRTLWYPGRPLLVTANDPETGLYNGDTGVVVDDRAGHLLAAFGDPVAPRLVRLYRLPAVETVYAMTVHRGQGSSFDTVSVLLPPASSPLLTRELLYTAITRARHRVRVIGSEAAVRRAVERPVRRASGLRDQTRTPESIRSSESGGSTVPAG